MATPRTAPPSLDRIAVRRMFARAGDGAPEFARAMEGARAALLERLGDVRIAADRILDLGSGTGAAAREISRRFPAAEVVCVDPVGALLECARTQAPNGSPGHRYVAGEAERLPLSAGAVDLIVSSLALPWFDPIDAALAECRRTLRPGGLLMLSTLGPATLKELSGAWSEHDGSSRMHPFADMHALGDALVRAGFADVVMDVERVKFRTPDFWGLCRVLSRSGGSGVLTSRRRGLTGVEAFRAAAARYESQRNSDGALPVSVELVFGHAWAPGPARPTPAGVVPSSDWTTTSRARR